MHPVDTVIVSDVHLGSFTSRSKELLAVLKKFKMRRLILNGDFFDDLDFSNLQENDWELFSHVRELTKAAPATEVVWISGNHDGAAPVLSRILGVSVHTEYLFEWGGKRCLAIHGNQFDRFLNKNVVISTMATWVYLLIQRLDGKNQRFARFLKRMSKAWLRLSKKVAAGATWYAKHIRHADIVFCGHTHLELHLAENGVEYWNSGCWTDIPSTYITLNHEKIEIHRVW